LIIETTYSRNVLAAVVNLIHNWIDKKTVDSLLFVVMDRGRKISQCRELGFRCWFSGKMLAFSQSMVFVDHVFVGFNGRNFLLSIWSLSKSCFFIFIIICLELSFIEWIFIYRKKNVTFVLETECMQFDMCFDRGSLSINLRYKWSINLSSDQVSVYYSFNCFLIASDLFASVEKKSKQLRFVFIF
jgi:hypothetical protein